jgi:hypothetical protein
MINNISDKLEQGISPKMTYAVIVLVIAIGSYFVYAYWDK